MTENNEPSLDDMLKAIPKLTDADLKKLYKAIKLEAGRRKLPLENRFAMQAGNRRPR